MNTKRNKLSKPLLRIGQNIARDSIQYISGIWDELVKANNWLTNVDSKLEKHVKDKTIHYVNPPFLENLDEDITPSLGGDLDVNGFKITSSDDGDIIIQSDGTGNIYFGGDTNRTRVDPDGTVVYEGTAMVWEDLNFDPTKSGGPASQRPDDVTINNIFRKEFTSGNNQSCGDTEECPHKAALGQTYFPHLHIFLKSGESAGTTGVTFRIYWELRSSSGVTNGNVDLSATSAELTSFPTHLTLADVTGFTGPTVLGAQLSLALYRTAGDAGDVIVETYGVHYAIDMDGSRTIDVK